MLFATPYAKTLAAEKGVDLKVCFGVCYCFCCCEKDIDLKVCLAYVVTLLLLTVFVHICQAYSETDIALFTASCWQWSKDVLFTVHHCLFTASVWQWSRGPDSSPGCTEFYSWSCSSSDTPCWPAWCCLHGHPYIQH